MNNAWISELIVPLDSVISYDSYQWRKKIWDLFPNSPNGSRDFLFRVCKNEIDQIAKIIVVSQSVPTCPIWCDNEDFKTKIIPEKWLENDCYRFEIFCNPARDVGNGDKRMRLSHVDPTKLELWINNKADFCGFKIINPHDLYIGAPNKFTFVGKDGKGSHVGVIFKGVLLVTNRDKFKNAFINGIGRARGYGYGMFILKTI